jgi:hypothetical protein
MSSSNDGGATKISFGSKLESSSISQNNNEVDSGSYHQNMLVQQQPHQMIIHNIKEEDTLKSTIVTSLETDEDVLLSKDSYINCQPPLKDKSL